MKGQTKWVSEFCGIHLVLAHMIIIFGLAHNWQEKGRICHGIRLTTNPRPPVDKTDTQTFRTQKLFYQVEKKREITDNF